VRRHQHGVHDDEFASDSVNGVLVWVSSCVPTHLLFAKGLSLRPGQRTLFSALIGVAFQPRCVCFCLLGHQGGSLNHIVSHVFHKYSTENYHRNDEHFQSKQKMQKQVLEPKKRGSETHMFLRFSNPLAVRPFLIIITPLATP